MRQTFPSITAETPEVFFASDASMTVLALNHAAMREVVLAWRAAQPKPKFGPVLPPLEQQAAALDVVLKAARAGRAG